MSYLVDALKKAERERHQQRAADMRSLSESEPAGHGRAGSRRLRWVVGTLTVCNVALLVYLLAPWAGGSAAPKVEAATSSQPQTVAARANSAPTDNPPARPIPTAATARSGSRSFAPSSAGAPMQPAPVRPVTARSAAPAGDRPLSSLRLSERPGTSAVNSRGTGGGQVTYARQPLDASSARTAPGRTAPAGPGDAPSAQSLNADVPQVSINGHLYSSVPGRSFILVNGRRYHEGERLAAGPAVESIDVTGATLNYRGRRYHVGGPG